MSSPYEFHRSLACAVRTACSLSVAPQLTWTCGSTNEDAIIKGNVKCRNILCGLTHSHASPLRRLAAVRRHRRASESVHEIDRIYQRNNNLFSRSSSSCFFSFFLATCATTSGSLNMCWTNSSNADDFWEASSRRFTWKRYRGKRQHIITATTVMADRGNNTNAPGPTRSFTPVVIRTPVSTFDLSTGWIRRTTWISGPHRSIYRVLQKFFYCRIDF